MARKSRPSARQWFADQYGLMRSTSAHLVLPVLVVALLHGVVRQDWALMLRAAFLYLPGAT